LRRSEPSGGNLDGCTLHTVERVTPETGRPPASHGIDVWLMDLSLFADGLSLFANPLSLEERERAERLRTPLLRQRFLAVRAALRWLLGLQLGIDPEDVALVAGVHGKPLLAGSEADRGLVFNVSHAADRAALALGWNRSLGIDIERIRPLRHRDALAERCLAADELSCWRAAPEAERQSRLFRHWVGKEAFGKATGLGIQAGFDAISMDLEPLRISAVPPRFVPAAAWHLAELEVAADYVGCLCYNGPPCEVRVAELALHPALPKKFPNGPEMR